MKDCIICGDTFIPNSNVQLLCGRAECDKVRARQRAKKNSQLYRDRHKDSPEYKERKRLQDVSFRKNHPELGAKNYAKNRDKIRARNKKEYDGQSEAEKKVTLAKFKKYREENLGRIMQYAKDHAKYRSEKNMSENALLRDKAESHGSMWSIREDNLLLELTVKHTHKELADIFGRSLYSINSRVQKLKEAL